MSTIAESKVVSISDDTFSSAVAEGLALVDFYAEWCGPCRIVAPILDEISIEMDGRVKFYKLDVDANPQTTARLGIRAIPTLAIFKNGQQVSSIVGGVSRGRIIAELEKHL